jgi:nitrate/TMAO reductase-like tetraheme cytochrome c subunit
MTIIFLCGIIAVVIGTLLLLELKPTIAQEQGGKILVFATMFILPTAAVVMGSAEHLERSKRTEFCLSCHPMHDYGKSLFVDDKEFVPANHFQNKRISREQACFTCHTDYTMYGDLSAKIRGVQHLYVQYLGTIPDTLKLYSPYNNRECLQCHEGARSFEGSRHHKETDTSLAAMKDNRLSCQTSGCHDVVHNVREVREIKTSELWNGGVYAKAH